LYKVYWTTNDGASHGQEFQDLQKVLERSQELRNSKNACFITTVGEDPNCTSLAGATVMNREDYHWKKRRR